MSTLQFGYGHGHDGHGHNRKSLTPNATPTHSRRASSTYLESFEELLHPSNCSVSNYDLLRPQITPDNDGLISDHPSRPSSRASSKRLGDSMSNMKQPTVPPHHPHSNPNNPHSNLHHQVLYRQREEVEVEEEDPPICMRVYVRDQIFHLTPSQISQDGPNVFSNSLARGIRVLKTDVSPIIFSLIVDFLSGYPIFPLSTRLKDKIELRYLLVDAQRLGLQRLEQEIKKEIHRLRAVPFLDKESVRNLINFSSSSTTTCSTTEPLDITRLLKNPEMFASMSEIIQPTLQDDEGIYKLSQISVSVQFFTTTKTSGSNGKGGEGEGEEEEERVEERCEIRLKSQHPFKYIEFPTVSIPKRLWSNLPTYILKQGGEMEKLNFQQFKDKFGNGPTLLSAVTIILIATECQGRFYQLKGFLGMIAYVLQDVIGNLMQLLHN